VGGPKLEREELSVTNVPHERLEKAEKRNS